MNISHLSRRFSFAALAFSMFCCSSICNGQAINWFPDASSAAQVAASENKIILLHFGAEWCRPCDQIDTYVFSDPTVQRQFAQKLVAVKVDADKQTDLVEEFGVKALPMDIAISPRGEILSKRKSPTVAASYLKMISDFEIARSKLEDPNGQVENAAHQIKEMAKKGAGIEAQTASFTPEFPYQQPHQPAASSTRLKQQSQVVRNPFVQQAGTQMANRLGGKNLGEMPMAPGKVMPQAMEPKSNLEMPKSLTMPGQLSMPKEMKLVEQQQPPALKSPESNDFLSPPSADSNEFSATKPADGQMTDSGQFANAKPVPPRNVALQRLEQSDVAARLVREQAEQKLAQFKSDPKLVMDDRFYGSHSAAQSGVATDGNYQAKINLPQENNGFVPPQPPNFGAPGAGSVMDRGVESLGTKATLASTTNSVLVKPDATSPIERGLEQASETPAKPNFALHGKCPVELLTKSKWVEGEETIGCVHRNRIYIFASQENLQTFQSDPDAYSPILAGYDPVIFEETGRLVDGMEEYGVFMGKTPRQRIVLFASSETRARFQLEPRRYLQTIRQAMDKSSSSTVR